MDKKVNKIDYDKFDGYVTVFVEAVNEYESKCEFIFIAYLDKEVCSYNRLEHLNEIAIRLAWLRGLYRAEIVKLDKSNLIL